MKKNKSLCIVLGILLFAGCAEKEEELKEGYLRIHGKTTNLENGKLIFYKGFEADTVAVAHNSFVYEAPLETIGQFYLSVETDSLGDRMVDPDLYSISLYLEPKVMDLMVDVKTIKNTSLTGSKTHDEYNDLNERLADVKEPYKTAFEEIDRLYTDQEKNKQAISDAYESLLPYYGQVKKVKKEFIKANPGSFISLETLNELRLDMDLDELDELYGLLSDSNKKTDKGEQLGADIKALKRTAVGNIAPNFTSTDVNGDPFDLSTYRGNYVLLDFWGSWYTPCRMSHPHLLEVYSEYSPKGFEIIGISDDDTRIDAWKKAIEEDKVGIWKHILRGKPSKEEENNTNKIDLVKLYGVGAFPTKILVDSEGKIVTHTVGYDPTSTWLEDKLAEIYDK